MLRCFLFAPLLLLTSCVGGTFGDHQDFEMFPLRPASEAEGRDLKRCLRAAHGAQENRKKRTGHYARKVHDLAIDAVCDGFLLAQVGTRSGYEIRAEKREDEKTVRWSVNEKGVIEEHLDPESTPDLEF
ncbi:MAG TPA: hypothetical protein VIH99_06290 [Bdellovibrionota bacterium]